MLIVQSEAQPWGGKGASALNDEKVGVWCSCKHMNQGWRQECSDGGADSSDEEAKIWLSGYYKRHKSPKNRFSLSDGGS